jgi:hypothetical protein
LATPKALTQEAMNTSIAAESGSGATHVADVQLQQQEKRDANHLMLSGVAIGVLGAVAAAVGGATCPVCVVAAPALLGIGAVRRWRANASNAAAARGGRDCGPAGRRE